MGLLILADFTELQPSAMCTNAQISTSSSFSMREREKKRDSVCRAESIKKRIDRH